jgi:hypothetical protein
VFNPQTGLFEQRVTVTNTSAGTIAGVRLYIENIRGTNGAPRTNVFLYNASGTTNGTPYAQHNGALNPGQTVLFTLEFYVPDRKPFTNDVRPEAIIPPAATTNSASGVTLTGFADNRVSPPRFVLEWASTPGANYTIIYSDDLVTWYVATPTITANNNRTQWYDDGPPKTTSAPFGLNPRYYQVILNP